MDPSVQFLMSNDASEPVGATIHSITPPAPVPDADDGKIGFTLDVAMRLDQEQSTGDPPQGVVLRIAEDPPEELADSA